MKIISDITYKVKSKGIWLYSNKSSSEKSKGIYIVHLSTEYLWYKRLIVRRLIVHTKFYFTTLHSKFKQRVVLWTVVKIRGFTVLQLRAIIASESLDFLV